MNSQEKSFGGIVWRVDSAVSAALLTSDSMLKPFMSEHGSMKKMF